MRFSEARSFLFSCQKWKSVFCTRWSQRPCKDLGFFWVCCIKRWSAKIRKPFYIKYLSWWCSYACLCCTVENVPVFDYFSVNVFDTVIQAMDRDNETYFSVDILPLAGISTSRGFLKIDETLGPWTSVASPAFVKSGKTREWVHKTALFTLLQKHMIM